MGRNGKEWGRATGRSSKAAVAEFVERVMRVTTVPRKERRWSFGMWLGTVARMHEAYVGAPDGVVRAWTIKRTGEQGRRLRGDMFAIRGIALRTDLAPDEAER